MGNNHIVIKNGKCSFCIDHGIENYYINKPHIEHKTIQSSPIQSSIKSPIQPSPKEKIVEINILDLIKQDNIKNPYDETIRNPT